VSLVFTLRSPSSDASQRSFVFELAAMLPGMELGEAAFGRRVGAAFAAGHIDALGLVAPILCLMEMFAVEANLFAFEAVDERADRHYEHGAAGNDEEQR